jgi:hypothetical protein
MPAEAVNEMTPAQVARRVAEIIRAHPGMHYQGSWWDAGLQAGEADMLPVARLLASLDASRCGTTCCVAGWAAAVTAPAGSVFEDSDVRYPDGRNRRIEFAAADALGLDASEETPELFQGWRTRDEVLAELDRIAGGGEP